MYYYSINKVENMENILIIVFLVGLCLNVYSTTFLKSSLTKITNIYKKIKMNEDNIFEIGEYKDTIYFQINGDKSKNYTIARYPNEHAGYEFALLII
jgi:hypothetical protein